MIALAVGELLFLHASVAAHLGLPRGVADPAALAAALAEANASRADGLFVSAAALATALTRHRPFHAANLAIAAGVVVLLLGRYDLALHLDAAEMPALRTLLAADRPNVLAEWLRERTAAAIG